MTKNQNKVPKTVEELLKGNRIGLTRSEIYARCRGFKISGWLSQLKELKDKGRIKVCGRFWGPRFKLID